MQFLIRLTLSSGSRPHSEAEGRAFIEDYIFPTLQRCIELQKAGKIIAGGPESGTVALALIVDTTSAAELDNLITSLPVWPRMETSVTALTTFEDRRHSVDTVLTNIKPRTRTEQTMEALR